MPLHPKGRLGAATDLSQRREQIIATLRSEWERGDQELQILQDIDQGVLDKVQIEQLLANACSGLQSLLGVDEVFVLGRVGPSFWPLAAATRKGKRSRALSRQSFTSSAFLSGVLATLDPTESSAVDESDEFLRQAKSYSYTSLVAVRIDRERQPFAVLVFASIQPLNGFARSVATDVSRQLAIAFEHCPAADSPTFKAVYSLSDRGFFGGLNLEPRKTADLVLEQVAVALRSFLGSETSIQILFPASETHLKIVYSTDEQDYGFSVPAADSVSGEALNSKIEVILDDIGTSKVYRKVLNRETIAECAVPILVGEEVVGVVNAESSTYGHFTGYPAYRMRKVCKEFAFALAFARINIDTIDSLERQGANEIFVALGLRTTDLVHTINSTLGAIQGNLNRLTREVADNEQALRRIRRIDGYVKEALNIPLEVKGMFDAPRPISINDLVRAYEAKRSVTQADVQMILDLAEELPEVEGAMIGEMVKNLLDNAVRASRQGTDQPRVSVATELKSADGSMEAFVVLRIADNGPGVPREDVDKLFAPKTKSSDSEFEQRSGLGLGLFLARKTVLRLGGDIELVSNGPDGACFEVFIPAAKEPK